MIEFAPSPSLLSRSARDRLIEQATRALYQEYIAVSHAKRRWDANVGFDWQRLRSIPSDAVRRLVEGFFAVEYYAPDYTIRITDLVRRSWGRAGFQLAWGAEEARHADLWGNVLVFSGAMSRSQLDEYADDVRAAAWATPWDSPIHMAIYTVFQERATQVIYQKTLRLVEAGPDPDPVLVDAFRSIVVDEAAHYRFYSDLVHLHLYYKPDYTYQALDEVIRHFVMPATNLYPNYKEFVEELRRHDIFDRRRYIAEIVPNALSRIGVPTLAALRAGVARSKLAPGSDGTVRTADVLAGEELSVIEDGVRAIFGRLTAFEERVGFHEADRITFQPHRPPCPNHAPSSTT